MHTDVVGVREPHDVAEGVRYAVVGRGDLVAVDANEEERDVVADRDGLTVTDGEPDNDSADTPSRKEKPQNSADHNEARAELSKRPPWCACIEPTIAALIASSAL